MSKKFFISPFFNSIPIINFNIKDYEIGFNVLTNSNLIPNPPINEKK